MRIRGAVGGLSIRARLTLWYATSMLAVFLAFAAALRTTVRSTLNEGFSSSLANSASTVSGFFRLEFAEYHDVRTTLEHVANEVVFPDRVIEFVQPDGRVAFRAVPLQRARRLHPVLSVATFLPGPVRSTTAVLAADVAPGWTVRVYAAAAPLERSLRRIDGWLLAGIPLGVLLTAAAGWRLAGRTLRPIGMMAAAAESMTYTRKAGGEGAAFGAEQRLPIDNAGDEIGRLGIRFNALLDQIDGVVAQQRHFLADAAHELRTPVARMLGSVELALMDPDDRTGQHAALVRVHQELGRTARFVDQLLQLARADSAGVIHCRPGYIDDVVADAVHAWHSMAEQRGVRLVLSTLEEAPALLDSIFVERLVGILLDNALRYTPPEGVVDVQVSWANGARVAVTDTGIGIGDDDRTRVFERFYRGVGARAMAPDGSGLGLPIARWIAEAHGATLALTPRADGGTIATVTFPVASATPPEASRPDTDGAVAPRYPSGA